MRFACNMRMSTIFFRSLSNEKETRKLKSREFLVEIGGLSRFIIEASAKHCIIVFYFVRRVAQPNGASVCLARAYIAFISIQWWWQTTTSFVLSIPSVVSFTHPQSLLVVENLKTLLVHRKKKRKKRTLFWEKKTRKRKCEVTWKTQLVYIPFVFAFSWRCAESQIKIKAKRKRAAIVFSLLRQMEYWAFSKAHRQRQYERYLLAASASIVVIKTYYSLVVASFDATVPPTRQKTHIIK